MSPRNITPQQKTPTAHKQTQRMGGNRVTGNGKQVVIAFLMSDKLEFKPNLVRRDKEGPRYILIKEIFHQEGIEKYKYIYTEYRHSQFYKTNTSRHKSLDKS